MTEKVLGPERELFPENVPGSHSVSPDEPVPPTSVSWRSSQQTKEPVQGHLTASPTSKSPFSMEGFRFASALLSPFSISLE